MPLFGNTFSPKRTPLRKSAALFNLHSFDRCIRDIELGMEYRTPEMSIGGQNLKFEDGQWTTESGPIISFKEVQKLKKRNLQLKEENNLLKLKIKIFLDMLSETTAESYLIQKELDGMKSYYTHKK